jgi:hypothetical protein
MKPDEAGYEHWCAAENTAIRAKSDEAGRSRIVRMELQIQPVILIRTTRRWVDPANRANSEIAYNSMGDPTR